MSRRAGRIWLAGMVASTVLAGDEPPLTKSQLKSGLAFAGEQVQAMQADDFANPGMLWLAQGERLWRQSTGRFGKSCAECHGKAAQSMTGVAARYPAFDAGAKRLLNLEGRINLCRGDKQGAEPLRYESEDLLALTAFVAHRSRAMPMKIEVAEFIRENFEAGKRFFHERRGQMNLSCAQCHDAHWGRRLLGETISQGHPNAYPVYRLEWQTLGSLHRRLRSCLSGVRAEMPPAGSPDLVDLELYLAWRANGLAIETPGVRR